MNDLNFASEFPQVALALIFSMAAALLAAFLCLRFIVRLVTREQYNVTDAPRRVRALVWIDRSGAGAGPADDRSGSATGLPYFLPAAAPRNRFTRNPKSGAIDAAGLIELSQRARGRAAQIGTGDNRHGAA